MSGIKLHTCSAHWMGDDLDEPCTPGAKPCDVHPLDELKKIKCSFCGGEHIPNGAVIGTLWGKEIKIDCRVPNDVPFVEVENNGTQG